MNTWLRDGGSHTFADYGRVVRRRWRIIGSCILLGCLLATAAFAATHKTYEAHTNVLVLPLATQTTATPSDVIDLDTEAQLVTSNAVARQARLIIGPEIGLGVADLQDRVQVSAPVNTTILSISFSAHQPKVAQAGAQAFATAYLANRQEDDEASLAARQKGLIADIADTRAELKRVTATAASLPDTSAAGTYAVAQVKVVSNELSQLNTRYASVSRRTSNSGRIVQNAALPRRPLRPVPTVYLLSGLLLGLLVGAVGAWIRERTDRRVLSMDDIEEGAGLSVLASVPMVRRWRRSDAPAMAAAGELAMQRLGNHLMSPRLDVPKPRANEATETTDDRPQKATTLLVTSASAKGRGRDQVAADLALSMSRSGRRIALVCAGDAEATAIRLTFKDAPGPKVVSRHHRDDDDPLAGERPLRRTLNKLAPGHEFVVLDAPPTNTGPDAQSLARMADGGIIVVPMGRTRMSDLRDARRQLTRVGLSVLGVVTLDSRRS
jgi:uncharacterized protein involved in exopolysaccharide biosynthesis